LSQLVAPAHDLADVGKADQLELADDLLDCHLGALSPGAHDLRDAGLNGKPFFTADSLAFPDILPFPLLSRHRLSADLLYPLAGCVDHAGEKM
jgi:hypothetical protein